MTNEAQTEFDQFVYPRKLREREEEYLNSRYPRTEPKRKHIGFALSGGGIRSATFCLGVFQTLASKGWIREIDYLSTVSGGGYFGAFFTRLFERLRDAGEVERVLTRDVNITSKPGQIQRWLRENGRYLAPQGSGSILYNIAIVLRNWFSMFTVVMFFALALFLAFEGALDSLRLIGIGVPGNAGFHAAPNVPLIVSTLIFFPLAALTFFYFPAVIAYWSFGAQSSWLVSVARAFFVATPAALVSAMVWLLVSHQALIDDLIFIVIFVFVIQYFLALVFLAPARSKPDDIGRNRLSRLAHSGLVTFLTLFVVAIIHTIALNLAQQGVVFIAWSVGIVSTAVAPFALYAPKLAMMIQSVPTGKKIPIPRRIVMGLVALVLLGGLAATMGAVAHYVFSSAPVYGWIALGVVLLICASLAFQKNFVNRCSLLPLYTARLVRAYLGASNLERYSGKAQDLLETHPDDDLGDQAFRSMYTKELPDGASGPPLHFINVTINETVSGRSQIQQQDRKGLGLAVGPFSYSAGAHHHYYRPSDKRYPEKHGHYVFDDGATPHALSLGEWTGISGAAFNTGLGSRTSLGLSLVTGLLNIRLGYWWDSCQKDRVHGSQYRWMLRKLFPIQIKLFDEWTARFKGTVERFWHLSDGGHFENLGGYELIRRKVPIIVVIDAEADPDYEFTGLANLTRKARLDFGAEISFFDRKQLKQIFDSKVPEAIGTLDELRRGEWSTDHSSNSQLDAVDRTGLSRAHAALASITYGPGTDASLFVYLKPTLTGAEPADLTEYHRSHPNFPHESTADQFFDEAQWESYRKLGERVAAMVFDAQETGFSPAVWFERCGESVTSPKTTANSS